MKHCISCGTELPDEARLCPVCGTAQTTGREIRPKVIPRRKIAILMAVLAVLLVTVFAVRLRHAPKVYDEGSPEIYYTDQDGTVKVFLTWAGGNEIQSQSIQDWSGKLEEGMSSAQPSKLFVYDPVTKTNLQESFLEKVESAKVTVEHADGSITDAMAEEPAYSENFPLAAMASMLYYTSNSGVNNLSWTLQMKNGDTIILHQTYTAIRLLTSVYTADDAPLDTLEDLHALMDQIWETEGSDSIATIYLPPVTYEGKLSIDNRSYNLIGSKEGDRQTTFTDTVSVNSQDPMIGNIESILFMGDGNGIGLSATKCVNLYLCTLRGWDIAAYARENSWVGIWGSTLEDNRIGFQFNAEHSRGQSAVYGENLFRNNETAVLLVQVPGSYPLSFPDTVFTGNGTDIDNQCGHPIQTEGAVFEPAD